MYRCILMRFASFSVEPFGLAQCIRPLVQRIQTLSPGISFASQDWQVDGTGTIDTSHTGRIRVWTHCSYTGLASKDAFAFSSCNSSHIGLFSASPAALMIWTNMVIVACASRCPGASPWWHAASCVRAWWWPTFLAVWRCLRLVRHPGVVWMMTHNVKHYWFDCYC